ncbi:bromodomain-containing protein 8-like isoform X1 [Acipenser ruthenus]|uniref:bromodomain-containing protein 8-like isoform X1 n=2 Tax=Acipenser ruthenus TaxID=7906 RepID=UPI002740357C|nr:bromodomain-containing protein 8-like isoform X1 [Acipenser ruthenus]
MATGVGKHKLTSTGPTEPWSIREKLCLASSVMRSGDQNWVSVSRAIKPFAEPGRPPDWFSQKHCASQYSELLETTETPKRKRGEKGEVVETVEDVIVRKLTAERIEELKKLIKETQEKHRKLKKEAELIQLGHLDNKVEEIWNDIVTKKQQDEEEAEMKKAATDAAYQVRQAAKNTPKRLPSVTVRSPMGSNSPGMDYPMADTPQPAADEGNASVAPGAPAVPAAAPIFMPAPETPAPPSTAPANLEANLSSLMEDSPQKKHLGQKATPPPSPLLSELLKKGSLLPTSPRLVGETEVQMSAGHSANAGVHMELGGMVPGVHSAEVQMAPTAIPASPAATGAPTLSRLLEAGPVQFTSSLASFSSVSSEPACAVAKPTAQLPLPAQPSSEPACQPPATEPPPTASEAAVKPALESSSEQAVLAETPSLVPSALSSECVPCPAVRGTAGEPKGDLGVDEDLVAVSYMGDELDLETVGDIIAIIEEKVDDNSEALDAAAVEAALSLCEEAADSQALSGPWEQPFKPEQDRLQLPESTATPPQDCVKNSKTPVTESVEIKKEMIEEELGRESSVPITVPDPHPTSQNSESPATTAPEFTIKTEPGFSAVENGLDMTARSEASPVAHSSPSNIKCESEESSQQDCPDSIQDENGPSCKAHLKDLTEEDGCSEEASVDEPKEEESGEAYLSEMENEPPISESDDGYSIHNAPLQMHTLPESIPSSPASSQFSVCSEDQEAIQAQKIWKKAIMLVWRAAANHRYANVFLQPVTDDIAPGYHSIVHRPMDLSTIKKNIENGLIRTTAEFQRDIMLMFQNAVMYNSSDHDVYHMAVEMQRDVLEQIQQFLATQLIMQTSESGISAKSLRGRDSTRKQDSSDKDSVPMGSPAFLLSLFDGGTRGRRCAIEADMKMKK